MEVMPILVRRTPELISQADPDMLKMVLVRGGNSCVIEQGGRQARVSAGEFAMYDTQRPYQVACGVGGDRPTEMMTFMFTPSLLPLPRNRLRELAAVRFPADAGLGNVTSQFLLQLACNVDHYSPAEAARLSTAALEVLATRLARELDARHWGTPEARRHALLTTVQAHPAAPGRPPAVTGCGRRRPSRVSPLPAPVVPRRGPDRGGLDPTAPAGVLPPGTLRPGTGRLPGRGHRSQVGLFQPRRLQPGLPCCARIAPGRIPHVCTHCEELCAVAQRQARSTRLMLAIRRTDVRQPRRGNGP